MGKKRERSETGAQPSGHLKALTSRIQNRLEPCMQLIIVRQFWRVRILARWSAREHFSSATRSRSKPQLMNPRPSRLQLRKVHQKPHLRQKKRPKNKNFISVLFKYILITFVKK